MIHIRCGTSAKTICGSLIDDLAKIDPNGATVSLVVKSHGEDNLQLRRSFDAIADRANCPECRKIYYNGVPNG